jgi:two-component system LytT family response regulator
VTLRAAIVDDEPFARERVRRLLRDAPDIEIVAECPDGFRAVAELSALRPDLLFLDVVMPGKDGFAVLDDLGDAAPAVIFLTAHDRFAIRAFEAAALDYLLKPFDEERFARALDRARRALGGGAADRARAVAFAPGGLTRFVVKHQGRIRFVKVADVTHIAAEGNYARVHAGGAEHLVRETLASLEDALDPARFVRIHRATIVNLDRVRELAPLWNGNFEVVLDTGARLTLSRRYRASLERRLGRALPG